MSSYACWQCKKKINIHLTHCTSPSITVLYVPPRIICGLGSWIPWTKYNCQLKTKNICWRIVFMTVFFRSGGANVRKSWIDYEENTMWHSIIGWFCIWSTKKHPRIAITSNNVWYHAYRKVISCFFCWYSCTVHVQSTYGPQVDCTCTVHEYQQKKQDMTLRYAWYQTLLLVIAMCGCFFVLQIQNHPIILCHIVFSS